MTYQTPCQRPENEADDWFIGKDGKQYVDDEFVSNEEVAQIRADLDPANYTDHEAAVEAEVRRREDRRQRAALQRRRRARDKCHVECILRLQCLGENLELPYGTAGGYYEEERRQIVTLRNERESRRRTVPAEE